MFSIFFFAFLVPVGAWNLNLPLSRRQAVAIVTGYGSLLPFSQIVNAIESAPIKKVVVAGATGQTGSRCVEKLSSAGFEVTGAVRSISKGKDKFAGLSGVNLAHLDVVSDTDSAMADTLFGADALIIAVGFIPGNPLKFNEASHSVDNVGTCRLIDAAKVAGVRKIVLVSSILTNGREWGQAKSPGFVVTNAFGNVLDEKIIAEKHLREASGIDYTILRPGGLKSKPPSGKLKVSGEDTLNSGEISRDLVADVAIQSLTSNSNKVLEIIEE